MDNKTKPGEVEDKLAIERVNEMISDERKKLEAIMLADDDLEPIMIEGETEAGYYCRMMVDPKDCAGIMLKHDYPTRKVLQEDFPDEMWEELGRRFGIVTVSSVDI